MRVNQSITYPERLYGEPDATPSQLEELHRLAPDAQFPPLGERQAETCIYIIKNVHIAVQKTFDTIAAEIQFNDELDIDHLATLQKLNAQTHLLTGFGAGFLCGEIFD